MTAEERLLESVIAYIGRRLGPGVMVRQLRVEVVGRDGMRQKITLEPTLLGVSTDDEEGTLTTPIRRTVLEVLTEAKSPLKGQAIARRSGRTYSGSFRATLAAMVREGLLMLLGEGYQLAEQVDDAPTRTTPDNGDNMSENELAERIANARAEKARSNGHHNTTENEHHE